jgi:hypothetical protein
VAVAAAPHDVLDALPEEPDSPWVVELRELAEKGSELPAAARDAIRRVVEAIVHDGCSVWDAACAMKLLERL